MQLRQINNSNTSEFSQIMDIYSTAFPKNETRSIADTVRLLNDNNSNYRLLGIFEDRDKSERCLGFMLVYVFDDFALLDYMAVHKNMRSKGIGRTMLDQLKRILFVDSCQIILLEIQHETKSDNGAARIKFYEKNGAVLITDRYIMPSYNNESEEEMNLMALYNEDAQKKVEITLDRLADMIRQIYMRVYECSREDLIKDLRHNYNKKEVNV